MALRAWALLLAAACGGDAPLLAPVIDVPPSSSPAYPFTDIDALELSVAHAGNVASIAAVTVDRGQIPELTAVPFGDDLVVHLSGRRGGIEVAYGRTCVVAVAPDEPPPTPHLYFARIVKWAPGPTPIVAAAFRRDAYATPDGDAVLLGGTVGDAEVGDLERFDADQGRFVALPAQGAPRRGAVLAALPDGRALRIGGATGPAGTETAVASFELISPTAVAELVVQTIDDDRLRLVEHAGATLVDGEVMVTGGRLDEGGGFLATGATWLFRLGDAGIPGRPRLLDARLLRPRARHTATRLGEEVGAAVLVIGGRDTAGPIAPAELYEPLREAFATFNPELLTPRYDHVAVRLPDGSILVLGGRDAGGQTVAALELYLPRIGQFRAAGTMPAGAGLVDVTATPLPDGRVLVAGGRDEPGTAVSTTYIARLDPIDGTVDISQTDSLAVPRAGHSAVRLCDGTVLLVGGSTDPLAPGSERYNPPSAGRR